MNEYNGVIQDDSLKSSLRTIKISDLKKPFYMVAKNRLSSSMAPNVTQDPTTKPDAPMQHRSHSLSSQDRIFRPHDTPPRYLKQHLAHANCEGAQGSTATTLPKVCGDDPRQIWPGLVSIHLFYFHPGKWCRMRSFGNAQRTWREEEN